MRVTYFLVVVLVSIGKLTQKARSMEMTITKDQRLSHLVFTENLLLETDAVSVVDCARLCLQTSNCTFFTVTSVAATQGTADSSATHFKCREHSFVQKDILTKVPTPETRFYSSQPQYTRTISAWLKKVCSTDTNCEVPQSECFAGSCLCSPGYYFSHSSDSCVEECQQENLTLPFLAYPGYRIHKLNIGSCKKFSESDECLEYCASISQTRTCDIVPTSTKPFCCAQAVTRLDATKSWQAMKNAIHFQYTCV